MNIVSFAQNILNLIPYKIRKTFKHLPGIKPLQLLFFNKWLKDKSFITTISTGPAKGLVFPVEMPQDKQMWLGTWEPDSAEFMARIIQPGFICFDIGGYKGYFSGIMALHGAKNVFVFEPMPDNAKNIRKLIKLNQKLPIQLIQAAVSNYDGNASFKMMQEQMMGKLEHSTFQNDEEFITKIEVESVRLDTLMENNKYPVPDFIKIDVEGAEELVLEGAEKLLENKKPVIMVEIHSGEIGKRCLKILRKYYSNITILETGEVPDQTSLEIFHYVAHP